jgi:acetylornithine/N-succinyldiaminopimelate aminotransferase
VTGVRGAGLLLGITLAAPCAAAATGHLRRAGILVNPVRPDVLRLAPPLILTAGQADEFLAALPAALDAAAPGAAPPAPARPAERAEATA